METYTIEREDMVTLDDGPHARAVCWEDCMGRGCVHEISQRGVVKAYGGSRRGAPSLILFGSLAKAQAYVRGARVVRDASPAADAAKGG